MSELNLIPGELKYKRIKKLKMTNYISSAIIVFAILFTIVYIPKLYLNKLTSDESNLDTKISNNSKLVEQNKKLLADIKSATLYNNEVNLLIKKAVKVTPKIKNFEKYIPKDVVLTNLTYSKGIINIAGTSTNYNSITAFAANLQMSKEYPLARIIKIDSSVGYIFTIMISE